MAEAANSASPASTASFSQMVRIVRSIVGPRVSSATLTTQRTASSSLRTADRFPSSSTRRHYGRAPVGARLVAKVPHGYWKTLTLVAALRVDGMTAPYVLDGAIDGLAFLAY